MIRFAYGRPEFASPTAYRQLHSKDRKRIAVNAFCIAPSFELQAARLGPASRPRPPGGFRAGGILPHHRRNWVVATQPCPVKPGSCLTGDIHPPLASRIFQQLRRDDVALDFGGAFVDARDARIAERRFDARFTHVAHAAVDLHRGIHDFAERLGREQLRR